MKKLVFAFLLILGTSTLNAQDFSKYNKITYETEQDYVDNEDKVLECANYTLSHGPDHRDYQLDQANKFVLIWMIGCPYTFEMWSWGTKIAKKESMLMSVYFAALVKVGLESREFEGIDAQYMAALMVLTYLKNESFEFKRFGYIKKFIKAGDNGTLKEFIAE